VCFVAGAIWVFWRVWGNQPVPEGVAPPAASTQSAARADSVGARPMNDPASSPTSGSAAGIASSDARGPAPSRPIDPPLQLVFQTPQNVSVGHAFDVRVGLYARRPTDHIVVEIDYDPALLKARSREEIEYVERVPGEPAFDIDAPSEGHAAIVMKFKRGEAPPMNVPLVQFEALAPGVAHIRITSISASDVDRDVPLAATGREAEIVLVN
jgi:hypothetical protein